MKYFRKSLIILALAALHMLLSFVLAFSGGITGGIAGRIYRGLATLLVFPLSIMPDGPDWLFFPLWILISLLWGYGIYVLVKRLARA